MNWCLDLARTSIDENSCSGAKVRRCYGVLLLRIEIKPTDGNEKISISNYPDRQVRCKSHLTNWFPFMVVTCKGTASNNCLSPWSILVACWPPNLAIVFLPLKLFSKIAAVVGWLLTIRLTGWRVAHPLPEAWDTDEGASLTLWEWRTPLIVCSKLRCSWTEFGRIKGRDSRLEDWRLTSLL